MFIRVELKHAVVGIEVKNGMIVQAPPVIRGWIGKLYSDFYLYYEKRNRLVKAEQLKGDDGKLEQTSLSFKEKK